MRALRAERRRPRARFWQRGLSSPCWARRCSHLSVLSSPSTPCARGCIPMCQRLQPHVPEAATLRAQAPSSPRCCSRHAPASCTPSRSRRGGSALRSSTWHRTGWETQESPRPTRDCRPTPPGTPRPPHWPQGGAATGAQRAQRLHA
eukprot:scaffold122932_cov63-Phaeocystis_antarctica.AAC.1